MFRCFGGSYRQHEDPKADARPCARKGLVQLGSIGLRVEVLGRRV